MKKIIVLLFLICAIPLSACSKAPEQIPAPTVQRLTSPLELSEDEAATLIQCCGENSVLLAVGHRNTAQTGPLYNTDYLLYWNYSDGTTKQFPVSSPAYIISAVLDGSDVLYVDYEAVDSGLKWSLPASVYGLVLLLAALNFKLVKLDDVKEVGTYLTGIFPLLFVPAAAGVMELWAEMGEMLLPILVAIIPVTVLVMVSAGKTTQALTGRKKKEADNDAAAE